MTHIDKINASAPYPAAGAFCPHSAVSLPASGKPLYGLPSPISTSGEYRAFLLYDAVPESHLEFTMDSDKHAPFVRRGETVIADPTDREVISGELYLCAFTLPNGKRAHPSVMQVNIRHDQHLKAVVAWFCPLNRDPHQIRLSDGPLSIRFLPKYIVGRVIGILQPTEARHA